MSGNQQGKGAPMFFLLRAAFWLSLVVLLLPADNSGQNQVAQVSTGEAINVAQTFVSDVSGFCERNPNACETGQSALKTFGSKAQYGAKLLYGYVGDFTGNHDETAHRTVATTDIRVQPVEGNVEPVVTFHYPETTVPTHDGLMPSAVATHTGSVNSNY